MKRLLLILGLLGCTFFTACSNSSGGRKTSESELYGLGKKPDECLGLDDPDFRLAILDQRTSAPAKVSVFFQVTDRVANPIADLGTSDFSIYEQGRNDPCFSQISESESLRLVSTDSQNFRNQTLLLLDLSSSVLGSSLDSLKLAARDFVTTLMPEESDNTHYMGVYGFDGKNRLIEIQRITSDRARVLGSIDQISEETGQDPSTDLYGAVIKITEIAEQLVREARRGSLVASASVVLFTDGTDQAARYSQENALRSVDNADPSISFYTIGLGDEIDSAILALIGKTFSTTTTDIARLTEAFISISDKVSTSARSFYNLEYCSPKRTGSGVNNLVIELNYQGGFGAVQTSFNANGFVGGCDPRDFEGEN